MFYGYRIMHSTQRVNDFLFFTAVFLSIQYPDKLTIAMSLTQKENKAKEILKILPGAIAALKNPINTVFGDGLNGNGSSGEKGFRCGQNYLPKNNLKNMQQHLQ